MLAVFNQVVLTPQSRISGNSALQFNDKIQIFICFKFSGSITQELPVKADYYML